MHDITELQRLPAPVNLPQSLAWDGANLWMGSLDTKRIYKLDRKDCTVIWDTAAPGLPFGITSIGDELRVLCGESDNDNRFIRRCIPGKGFDTVFKISCPDDTGSQLSYDGQRLHVSQWYNRRVLALGADNQVIRVIPAPRGICGQVIVGNLLYLATTEAEETNEYFLTRVDLQDPELKAEDVARIPFPARALAHDGDHFWTNHRAQHEIVRFDPFRD